MWVPERAAYGVPQHEQDQMVVAVPHLRPVLQRLAEDDLGIHPEGIDRSEELGLALVPLPPDAMDRWDEHRAGGRYGAPLPRLAALLSFLYDDFRRSFSWTPTIGMNRAVHEVVGGNHTIGVGDEGFPQPPGDLRAAGLALRDGDPGAGVLVGVADTVLYPSSWLEGGYQAPPAALRREDGGGLRYESGHATFVTGAILQQAPGAVVSMRRVLGDDGLADSWSVAKALVRFERLGVQILNLSLGHFTDDDQEPLVMTTALNRLDPDLVVVASAGNHGGQGSRPLWPAALPRVVAVGATNAAGEVAPWSPAPPAWPWVDVLATGEDVVSTYPTGPVQVDGEQISYPQGLARWSGTSFAAARVSGAVAARTQPGHKDAATALRELLADPDNRNRDGLPWIR
jgi:membrane-anchored mycosin MYCP